ncbi:interferon gamma receptor 1 [Oxyura jamaicensis]|uniref:interferon gamma receptor 1 n=1 Tax=Oxyura jamaicensis TaxID=8884 RepID=UPI0015A71BB6|nr:interferon gamma receptor 1 [Oxyura jamaicensis]
MRLLLALLALLAPGRSAMGSAEQPPAVPSPTDLVVTSQNFKTVLSWQYQPMSETPHFVVEIKPYLPGTYMTVSACVNISTNSCDLSREIKYPSYSHWFRVKAVVGSEQSEYAETNEFILLRHGKIGPPKLNLSSYSDKIAVDIYPPVFPSMEVLPWISTDNSEFAYKVTFWDKETQLKEEVFTDCPHFTDKCSLDIPVTPNGSMYCVSAKGLFFSNLVVGAPSEESCVQVPLEQTESRDKIIIVCVAVVIISVILTLCCGFKKLRERNIKLPKSLVTVIRNLNMDNTLESKSEGKYISIVSVMPVQSALPLNSKEALLNIEPEEEAVSHENFSEGASSCPLPEAPDKVEESSVQKIAEEVPSDDEQNCKVKESYFISDSNQTDVSSNSTDPEVSATEIQQTVIPRSCPKFSGYDKPHVPLDMLIDVGEEQPVIAYRPTD